MYFLPLGRSGYQENNSGLEWKQNNLLQLSISFYMLAHLTHVSVLYMWSCRRASVSHISIYPTVILSSKIILMRYNIQYNSR